MNYAVLKLWLTLWVSVGAVALAMVFGFAQDVYVMDHSHLTSVILALYFINSLMLLQTARKAGIYPPSEAQLNTFWYTSELFFGLGIIGNLIGVYLMFKGFVGADFTSAAVKQALQAGAVTGIGTACLVTMLGVVCSYALKYQLVQLEIDPNEQLSPFATRVMGAVPSWGRIK